MDELYIIKDRLNEALRMRGMTASDLSKKTGLNKSSVSRYLSGKSIPRSLAIGLIADALNVSPTWVLGYDVTIDGKEIRPQIELYKLTSENQTRLLAYYQALSPICPRFVPESWTKCHPKCHPIKKTPNRSRGSLGKGYVTAEGYIYFV